jgi:hypothetical protein
MTSTTHVDTRDMLVVHDSIRRQFGQAPALVRGVAPGDSVRAAVVADHVDLLGALLHHHHAGEDRLLWPVLQPPCGPTPSRPWTGWSGSTRASPRHRSR